MTTAVFAVCAFSVVFAATASAEATLLAEWLIKGSAVTTLTPTMTEGTTLMEDKTFGDSIECHREYDGSVGDNGEDEVTRILSLMGEEVTLTKPLTVASGDCKIVSGCNSADAVEWDPLLLPWHTLMFLDASGEYLDIIFKAGYEVTCTILGIKVTDECTVENASVELVASIEGAEAKGVVGPNASCTVGGAGSGKEEYVGTNHLLDTTGDPVIQSSGA